MKIHVGLTSSDIFFSSFFLKLLLFILVKLQFGPWPVFAEPQFICITINFTINIYAL